MLARVAQFLTTSARHALPLGGIFAVEWHPFTALAVYWVESVLLVLAAALLALMIKRRLSDRAIAEARAAGDEDEAKGLAVEAARLRAAAIAPKDVLAFHLGSLFVFAGFLGGVTIIIVGNGHLEPVRWGELTQGIQAMAIVATITFALDVWRFDSLDVAAVAGRVNACLARWAMFWLVGFFGTGLAMFTGRPTIIFGFFAVLKVIFESWARLAQLFGWRSLKDRQASESGLVASARD